MDGYTASDEGHFAETLDQRVEAEFDRLGEDDRIVLKGGLGAGYSGFGFADYLDRLLGDRRARSAGSVRARRA